MQRTATAVFVSVLLLPAFAAATPAVMSSMLVAPETCA
jgi:hypothetical protein